MFVDYSCGIGLLFPNTTQTLPHSSFSCISTVRLNSDYKGFKDTCCRYIYLLIGFIYSQFLCRLSNSWPPRHNNGMHSRLPLELPCVAFLAAYFKMKHNSYRYVNHNHLAYSLLSQQYMWQGYHVINGKGAVVFQTCLGGPYGVHMVGQCSIIFNRPLQITEAISIQTAHLTTVASLSDPLLFNFFLPQRKAPDFGLYFQNVK